MPRFFFILHRGSLNLWDPEGVILPTAADARSEALLIAHDLAGRKGLASSAWKDWSILVCEDGGGDLLDLPLIEAASEKGGSEKRDGNVVLDERNVIAFPLARCPPSYGRAAIRELLNQTHRHVLLLSVLADRQRYARKSLSHEVKSGREKVSQARELVRRSRIQSHAIVLSSDQP